MKKSLWAASGVAVTAAVLFGAAPYYLGIKAEQSLSRQHEMLAQTSFLRVESREYARGWFSSTETTVLRFKPTFLAQIQDKLPDNLKTLLKQPITVNNHIRHHLFANGVVPVRAVVDSEFAFQPESQQILQRFFGNQQPVSLSNVIRLDGSGKLEWQIPAFQYEELSGIAIQWQGLQGETEYARHFSSYQTDIRNPGVTMTLADKGSAAYSGLHIRSHTEEGRHGLSLGSSEFKLDSLALEWKDSIEYDIKLNELINMVSDLQIGSFLNPYGQVAPSKVKLENLYMNTGMSEAGQWINTEGRFGFAKLVYGEEQYGPLAIEAAAEHLDPASLLALKQRRDELISRQLDENEMREALLASIRNEAAGLFTNDPVITLRRFEFAMPQGAIRSEGALKFNGLTAPDLNDFNAMMRKTDADFQISLPQKLVEQLAVAQAKNYISVDPEAGDADAEISEAVRLWLDSMLTAMADQGYLKLDQGIISTQIVVRDNILSMNGKKVEVQPDADLLPDSALEEGAAETAVGAEAASEPVSSS